MRIPGTRSLKASGPVRRGAWVTGISSALVIGAVALAGYFDRDPVRVYPAVPPAIGGTPPAIAAVNFSGDMGMRFLLGASTSRGLTQAHIPVVGITTPVLFRRHRSRAEVDAAVANGLRAALAATHARRLVVIGQSYGADIVQTGLAHLPADLRSMVAAIVLILPGDTVFFRADPSGLEYDHTTPDSVGITSARTIDWAPLTCIQGIEEEDSLCPLLHGGKVTRIAMPGGHTIRHDEGRLLAHVLGAIRRALPATDT